jgi:hypothetical protein
VREQIFFLHGEEEKKRKEKGKQTQGKHGRIQMALRAQFSVSKDMQRQKLCQRAMQFARNVGVYSH